MPNPPPNQAVLGQMQNRARLAYQQALARIGQQRGDMLRDYGYEGEFDAQGNLSNLRVSANNPYGRYQQMLRGQAADTEAQQYAAVGRGFTGGGINSVISQMRQEHGGAAADLGTGMSRGIAGLLEEQRGATTEYDQAMAEAQLEATRQAIEEERFNQANYQGLEDEYPGGGDEEEELPGDDELPPVGGRRGGRGPARRPTARRVARQVRNRAVYRRRTQQPAPRPHPQRAPARHAPPRPAPRHNPPPRRTPSRRP